MTYEIRDGRLVRTAFSMKRAMQRQVWRTPDKKPTGTAADHQDLIREKYLSRSKPYENKGVQEAARRVRQMRA